MIGRSSGLRALLSLALSAASLGPSILHVPAGRHVLPGMTPRSSKRKNRNSRPATLLNWLRGSSNNGQRAGLRRPAPDSAEGIRRLGNAEERRAYREYLRERNALLSWQGNAAHQAQGLHLHPVISK